MNLWHTTPLYEYSSCEIGNSPFFFLSFKLDRTAYRPEMGSITETVWSHRVNSVTEEGSVMLNGNKH
jgi:hypothetical protein